MKRTLLCTLLAFLLALQLNAQGTGSLPCYRIDASLDGRIPVTIAFQKDKNGIIAGYIYYPKAKNPSPILIVGTTNNYDGADNYHLCEYQDDGIITGIIYLQTKNRTTTGTWMNPKTLQDLQMKNITSSRQLPQWFKESALKPEDPGNIGKKYSFQQWHQGYESLMGGHITFRAAGKNKVHFECANVRHNIAEGKSQKGRPAELKGNRFEYRHVNECGYGFKATFYQCFVVLQTITGNESLECFGAGASFEGVYIKVKQ